MAHVTRAIPRPSKPDGTDPVAEIKAAIRRALRFLTVAAVVIVALVLGVLLCVGVPLALVGVVAGLAALVAFASAPWRS